MYNSITHAYIHMYTDAYVNIESYNGAKQLKICDTEPSEI